MLRCENRTVKTENTIVSVLFVENGCVCIRLIGPTCVVVLSIWLFAVFTVITVNTTNVMINLTAYYAVRLIITFVDVNKTYLILSYLTSPDLDRLYTCGRPSNTSWGSTQTKCKVMHIGHSCGTIYYTEEGPVTCYLFIFSNISLVFKRLTLR